MRTILRILMGLLTIFLGLILLLTDIMSFIKPVSAMYIFSPLTLFFSTFFLLIFLLAIYWICVQNWHMMIICVMLLSISLPNTFKTYTLSAKTPTTSESESISIMSYNVQLFKWFGNDKKENDGLKTLDYIRSANPDIICLQEMLYYKNGIHTLEFIKSELKKYPYCYIKVLNNSSKVAKCVATFSKYPITKTQDIDFGTQCHGGIITQIKKGTKTLNVINIYLKSNQLTQQEKDLFPDATSTTNNQPTNIISRIYNKLVTANLERISEAEFVSQAIQPYSYNQIICGDFNDIPASYTYRVLREGKKDAFLELGQWSTGDTFNEGIYRFRIDYIFTSDDIRLLSFERDKQTLSDHYPITLTLKTK